MRWPAEEVDTLLYDVINNLHEHNQYDPSQRQVFEHVMAVNTMHDEPDAPPITVDNKFNDDPCPPWEFYYTNKLVYGQNVKRGDPKKLKGCKCVGGCRPDSKTCACLRRQHRHFQLFDETMEAQFNYDQNGRVIDPRFPIFECNDACGCDETCMNRVVQHGRQIPVEIANTRKKGWGVFAKADIPANTFVGIYAGELITDRESHARGAIYELFGRTYMFTIDNWYLTNEFRRKYRRLHRPETLAADDHGEPRPGDENQSATFVVDAFHVGNFTRFLNHCCDPNCVVVSVHVNEPHIYKPYLCLFTSKDVKIGEELTFSYRGVIDEEEFKEAKKQNKGKRRKRGVGLKGQCQCNAPRCIGTLF
ncbi:SET domain-containing protein [Auricularia subglabra TFB-10046 SS5]|uniref:SET domain-containing protein n=1 Tax=Auricularia subglabra (strain TFB-10046 / SS5) TaxID=717982 RepID=J0WS16_AURST|nr:SET domain-containing protein [Auricularia subglabra TFB-10046 SS5]